ncbi:uncharacterized protein LOC121985839 isoform X2 [Zingiber officinale]|uniref:Methyltransferase type 12 domain-containing protein n=1 Tax=Zingiber officinale TaxID=94328 RepID=A0A8J5IF85_ZINOF|nr:uncharacterized protein LOC121985839 isoform X2 [Zingiber officinale]KAG6534360.1 hypothetical protein ZIOFF_008246 [Zingiber officinale]
MAEEAATSSMAGELAVPEGAKKIQIYSTSLSSSSARQVTPFWKEKYEKDAKKYWDLFYKRHQDRFFKDRHYLDKEWGDHFLDREVGKLVVLEVGCGAGNTIFPLVATYPHIFVHACDFSPRAIELVKSHKDFSGDHINAFVCDLTIHNLSEIIAPASVDIVTMIFVLSAVSPEKMPLVLDNLRRVLKPNGLVLFRDYATGDLAQERLISKEQEISENFFVRGDGTRAYYFTNKFLVSLFQQSGFNVVNVRICNKQVMNRSQELVMNRRWIQAVFSNKPTEQNNEPIIHNYSNNYGDAEVDISGSVADLFCLSSSADEVIKIEVKGCSFRIKALTKEYQHTCKSTGLMLWESARLMCNIIAENPSIIVGKRMLELGCGSAGICSMIAAQHAEVVVSTDGDTEALSLLRENISTNLPKNLLNKIVINRLIWGNMEDVQAIKDFGCYDRGFDIIIGTDVTYSYGAISPLFETARELICSQENDNHKPALVLCHIERRINEDSIVSTASTFGFKLVDRWVNGIHSSDGIIRSWFSEGDNYMSFFRNTPLTILYFHS